MNETKVKHNYFAEKLKKETNPLVQTQYNIFDNYKDEDMDELHSRFDNVHIEMDDLQDCFEVLKNTTLETSAEPFFLSILQHLLFIRDDFNMRYKNHFSLSKTTY